MTAYSFQGSGRRGVGATGRTTENPAEFVKRLYDAGWKTLTVRCDDEVVGEIWKSRDTGVRVWYAEVGSR